MKLFDILNESDASEEAKRKGLEYLSFGRYGKDGKVTHKVVNGKLQPVAAKAVAPATTKEPPKFVAPSQSPKDINPEPSIEDPSKLYYDEPEKIVKAMKVPSSKIGKAIQFINNKIWGDDLNGGLGYNAKYITKKLSKAGFSIPQISTIRKSYILSAKKAANDIMKKYDIPEKRLHALKDNFPIYTFEVGTLDDNQEKEFNHLTKSIFLNAYKNAQEKASKQMMANTDERRIKDGLRMMKLLGNPRTFKHETDEKSDKIIEKLLNDPEIGGNTFKLRNLIQKEMEKNVLAQSGPAKGFTQKSHEAFEKNKEYEAILNRIRDLEDLI